jgi:hypothetical protein
MIWLITWDRVEPLGGKWRPSVGKVGECDVASRHIQGYSLHLGRLRTDGLAPASKYWTYWSHASDIDSVNQCTLSSIDAWLKRTAFMAVLGEKLRQVPRTTQPGWEVESGVLFLGSSESVQLCWVSVKGYHVRGLPTESVRVVFVDWRKKCTCRVYQVFPYRVYQFESPRLSDMINHLSHGGIHVAN